MGTLLEGIKDAVKAEGADGMFPDAVAVCYNVTASDADGNVIWKSTEGFRVDGWPELDEVKFHAFIVWPASHQWPKNWKGEVRINPLKRITALTGLYAAGAWQGYLPLEEMKQLNWMYACLHPKDTFTEGD